MGLAEKSFSVFVRDIFLFVANAFIGIILARSLGPLFLGLWFSLNMVPSYAELFGRIKIDLAAVFYLSKKKYTVQQIVPVINTYGLFFAGLIIALALCFKSGITTFLFKEHADDMRLYYYLILVQIPSLFIYMNYLYIHIYREDTRVVNNMALTRSLVPFIMILISLPFSGFRLSLYYVIICFSIGPLVSLIYGAYKLNIHSYITFKIDRVISKDLFSYGIQIYFTGILSYFNIYSIQFLVLSFLTPVQLSYFTIAQQNSQLMQKLSDAISVFLFPHVSKTVNVNEKMNTIFKVSRLLFLLLLPCYLVSIFVMEDLVKLIYGTKYLDVVTPILIMLPAIVLTTSLSSISTFFQSCGYPKLVTLSFVPSLTLQIGLGILIIPKGGIVGAAICFSCGAVTAILIQILILYKKFKPIHYLKFFLISKDDLAFLIKILLSIKKIKNAGR